MFHFRDEQRITLQGTTYYTNIDRCHLRKQFPFLALRATPCHRECQKCLSATVFYNRVMGKIIFRKLDQFVCVRYFGVPLWYAKMADKFAYFF